MTSGTACVSLIPGRVPDLQPFNFVWSALCPFLGAGSSVVSPRPTGSATPGARTFPGRTRQALTLKLFVLDPHTIYRRGLAACLELMSEVDSVAHAGSVRDAWEDPALFAAD